nr:mucin-1-like [Pocillopora verrucosa]
MRLLFLEREIPELFILLICLIVCQGKKHFKNNDDSSQESKSTFITIKLPANVATHNKGCVYDGVVRHHGDAWSPGPCIPECRCSHGHVKCSKIECPDLNCDKPIKKKWKCCAECLPLMDNGTTCGVWSRDGNGNGGCCVFPFEYNGVKHYTCTYLDHNKPWCSISTNFDRDGVWGECIDDGDTPKTLRFKDHRGEAQQQYKSTDDLISSIANNVANSVSNESASGSNASPAIPESSVTTPSGAAATVTPASVQPSKTAIMPATSVNASPSAANKTVQPLPTKSIQPQATGTIAIATANATAMPSPSPSVGSPVVSQINTSSAVQPASNQSVAVMASSVQPAASQSVTQAGQTAVIGQPGAIPTPSIGMGGAAAGAATLPLPGPTPQVTQQPQPQVTQQPSPQPSQQPALPLPEQPTPQPGQQPALQPAPAPAPVPGQPPVEGVTPGSPFPISQTTLTPGETQAPGNAPGQAGQAVHQLTTTEYNPNHNITTTESWFGKPNETLNRTNEVMNQVGQSNQASYGYQAASSQRYYQNQAPYNDQPSNSQPDYSSYNTQSSPQADYMSYSSQQSSPENNYPSYNAQSYNSYDNTAYQQYDRSQAQDTAGQANYYSNEQQYQQQYGADPGSYYTG